MYWFQTCIPTLTCIGFSICIPRYVSVLVYVYLGIHCFQGLWVTVANYRFVQQELREAFNKESLLLTASLSGYVDKIGETAYNIKDLGELLDFANVMAYDYHGFWDRKTGHHSPMKAESADQHPDFNLVSTVSTCCLKWQRSLHFTAQVKRKMLLTFSMTRLGDFLDFGQHFKAYGNNQFAQISHILRQF